MFKNKIASYIEASDYKLLAGLPIVMVVNGRSFSKLTALLDKPFSQSLAECFHSTLLKLVVEVDGSILGYSFGDELVIICRNDQTPETNIWFDGNLQKICSTVSSIATLQFNNCVSSLDLNLIGDPIFSTQIFTLPNIDEAINFFILRQNQAIKSSAHFACFYELLKKYDKNEIKEMLIGSSFEEKIDLLQRECNIDYDAYPIEFRRGAGYYRTPKLVQFQGEDMLRNKWNLNLNLPLFSKDPLLHNVLKIGTDIYRAE